MTLDEKIRQKLSDGSPGPGRHELLLTNPASGWTVTLTLDKQDEMSCLAWELKAIRTGGPALDLGAWAEKIASQVTGLLEPLKVLEIDNQRQQAILRSEKPTQRKDVQAYFEVFLEGTTSASVRRYQVPREGNAKREQTTFAMTHEGLIKLVGDLISR